MPYRISPRSLAAPLLLTVYVLLPIHSWGLLPGIPLGIVGAVVLFTIWWIWSSGGSLPGRWLLLPLVIAKLAAGFLLLVDHGFEADYYAKENWAPPVERSTAFRSSSFTRIDKRITFGNSETDDFPLYFLNDVDRFNFYRPGQPRRSRLPFSVVWRGHMWPRDDESPRSFYLRGKDVSAELWIDGVLIVDLKPPAEEATWRAPWQRGRHLIIVRLSAADRSRAAIEAGSVDRSGNKLPFTEAEVIARLFPPWRITTDRFLRPASQAIDAVLIAILVAAAASNFVRLVKMVRAAWRREAWIAVAAALAMAGGVYFAAPAADRLVILAGGSDYLTYEHYARDIALNGPLMLLGKSLGDARPFYYQPLYPYFLALVHLLFGEDLSVIYLVQWLLACATVVAVWRMSAWLFGGRIGWVGLLLAGIFFAERLVPLAGLLLTENLFNPLLCAWTLGLIRMASPHRSDKPVLTGLAGGLATLTRSTLLAGWVLGLLLLALARRRAGKSLGGMFLMMILMMAVVSSATVRNWIASNTFVPVTSSFAINFYLGNEPPRDVPIESTEVTARVFEFARIAPRMFVKGLLDKALFALGFFDRRVPGAGLVPVLIAIWTAALVGIGVLMIGNFPHGIPGPARALPAALSLSHFLVVTIIFPIDRLVLPLYLLLIPYAAVCGSTTVEYLVSLYTRLLPRGPRINQAHGM